ncbi:SAP domain-containing protein [Bradyrhizobium japonicum]|uniref:SAP domain-containing protein n=1 Tax=Bradyrhizobium japonicum TaxID=375 RepID=UPI0012BBA799|nr:SAP domain-containing protein [Bradyrhizobium japonicum]MBR1005152.1 SAP domain-containing protein [Bradyrhizobium liaoningense]
MRPPRSRQQQGHQEGRLDALLKHDDEVKAAIAAGNYDALTVDELKALADARKVDISGKSAKADLVAALKAADGPVVSG